MQGGGRGEGVRAGGPNGTGKAQHVKLVLLGDQGVGKSSIALRFVRGEFTENSEATIGAAFLTQTVNIQNQSIKFDIWDTAGQERYRSLAPMYYRGAQASIVVYDVNSTQSFQHAISWVQELRQQANSQTVIALAGNKADMAAGTRAIERQDAQAYADDQGLIFVETSAKTGMGVADVFLAVANKLAQRMKEGGPTSARPREGVKLSKAESKKGGCC